MPLLNVDQQRLFHAWQAVEEVSDKDYSDFYNALQGLGVSLRAMGLSRGMAVLYRDAKKSGVEKLVMKLATFVLKTRLGQTCQLHNAKSAMQAMINRAGNGEENHDEYWELLEETLAYVEHLKAVTTKPSAQT